MRHTRETEANLHWPDRICEGKRCDLRLVDGPWSRHDQPGGLGARWLRKGAIELEVPAASTDPVATDEIKQRTRSQGMLCTYCDVPELPQQPTGRERLLTQAN
jgi:hypothetical protein